MTKKWWLTILICGNVILWLIPSDVAEILAEDDDLIFEMYSLSKFATQMIFLLVTIFVMDIALRDNKKRCCLQWTILALSVAATSFIAYMYLLTTLPAYFYQKTGNVVHRIPAQKTSGFFRDRPSSNYLQKYFPRVPSHHFTLTTDKNGFRNLDIPETADILVIGDSFGEGYGVSDNETWSQVLQNITDKRIYNLSVTATNPVHYYHNLKKYIRQFSPQLVICMIFEGNDFRKYRIKSFANASDRMLRRRIKKRLAHYLRWRIFPWTSDYCKLKSISWLPLVVPTASKNYYHFSAKKIHNMYRAPRKIIGSRAWKVVWKALADIKKEAQEAQAEVLYVYVPCKTRVVMPLITEHKWEAIHSYLGIKAPFSSKFATHFFEKMDSIERAFLQKSEQENFQVVSTTTMLRQGSAKGRKLYFTYDDHWTALGNKEIAEFIAQCIKK
ncbi:SGNH/GDSL hydrolase family protein [Candidatus Uabimicrobium amorphum]|uniref:Uncharacterized protein n=1 Tax=Uabimicrobium amorphum TaxID=2596890 RepID=A0A5S9IMU4_UABAM|nr:SGNH/GDSL hydrolase family protein [Candidatus Uabimicrobium amorphum]BBM84232.1 hypothetical protein UABAM_02588 [Candidatus Uabimicrobium amorphum]